MLLDEIVLLQVIEVNGRLISAYQTTDCSIEMDVSDLKTGLYLMKISDTGHQEVLRFARE